MANAVRELQKEGLNLINELLKIGASVRRDDDDLIIEKDGKILVLSIDCDGYFAGGIIDEDSFKKLLKRREEYIIDHLKAGFMLGWELIDEPNCAFNHQWEAKEIVRIYKAQFENC